MCWVCGSRIASKALCEGSCLGRALQSCQAPPLPTWTTVSAAQRLDVFAGFSKSSRIGS